jgi:RNA-binding protein
MAPLAKLPGSALRTLRALGHSLSPVVALGKEGMTDALVRAADESIKTHELVKVKIQRESPVDRHEAAIELAARTGSILVQVLGRTVLLYRRNAKKPKISLDPRAARAEAAGAAASKPSKASKRGRKKRRTAGKGRGGAVENPSPRADDLGDND